MKLFECKCGSKEIFIEKSGNNTGLYCADCGKWITWLNKDQLRLANRQIECHNNEIHKYKEILHSINELGGCGASDDYSKGYDDGISSALNKIEEITGISVESVIE